MSTSSSALCTTLNLIVTYCAHNQFYKMNSAFFGAETDKRNFCNDDDDDNER